MSLSLKFLFFKNIFAMFTFFEKIIQKYSIELRIWILLFKLVLRISCYDLIYKVIKNYLDLNDWKRLTVVYYLLFPSFNLTSH